MGQRYQQQSDKESEISFRVVEIFVASKNPDGTRKKSSRYLLVDNRRETLETVQMNMHDFVRNAVLANSIESVVHNSKIEKASPDFPGVIQLTSGRSCASIP